MPVIALADDPPALCKPGEYEVIGKGLFALPCKLKFYHGCRAGDVDADEFSIHSGGRCRIILFCFFQVCDPFFNRQRLDVIIHQAQQRERRVEALANVVYVAAILKTLDVGAGNDAFDGSLVAGLREGGEGRGQQE